MVQIVNLPSAEAIALGVLAARDGRPLHPLKFGLSFICTMNLSFMGLCIFNTLSLEGLKPCKQAHSFMLTLKTGVLKVSVGKSGR